MLLLRAERLPEGPDWLYELKLDGYRLSAGHIADARSSPDALTQGGDDPSRLHPLAPKGVRVSL
jgi:ATP-dependent DNA ligase